MKALLDVLRSKPELYIGITTAIFIVTLKNFNDTYATIEIALIILFVIFLADLAKHFILNQKVLGPSWLYSGKTRPFPFMSIHTVERSVDPKCTVIIISPDLSMDTEDKGIIATVRYNLARGVNYIFVCSEIAEQKEVVDRLLLEHSSL